MAASVMSDDPVSLIEEEKHLVVPIVGRQGLPMMKDDRLRILGTPILIENIHAIFGGNESHGDDPRSILVAGGDLALEPASEMNRLVVA
jgi:hypothetical protein